MYKRILIILLFISLTIVIWLYFVNYKMQALFGLDATNINKLLENLSLAYIGSYIFYVVVVTRKEKEEEKVILPLIADNTYFMLNNIIMFTTFFREKGGLPKLKWETGIHSRDMSIYPSKNDINKACSAIKPNDPSEDQIGIPGLVTPHFFGLMIKFSLSVDYCLNIVLAKSSHLDVKFLKLLTDLKTSLYHREMTEYTKDHILTAKLRNNTLNSFERGFDEYYRIVREIEIYADKKLKKHVENHALKAK
jgi:hypothetical protein